MDKQCVCGRSSSLFLGPRGIERMGINCFIGLGNRSSSIQRDIENRNMTLSWNVRKIVPDTDQENHA